MEDGKKIFVACTECPVPCKFAWTDGMSGCDFDPDELREQVEEQEREEEYQRHMLIPSCRRRYFKQMVLSRSYLSILR